MSKKTKRPQLGNQIDTKKLAEICMEVDWASTEEFRQKCLDRGVFLPAFFTGLFERTANTTLRNLFGGGSLKDDQGKSIKMISIHIKDLETGRATPVYKWELKLDLGDWMQVYNYHNDREHYHHETKLEAKEKAIAKFGERVRDMFPD